ncbi:PD-(D/E)XK nuclease family protein [Actinomadura spongiicola]|uniref:PD-(D/E)XK nuclease family protein n=1 Tax=Actinomadura spongiicola TaxID=2303421 RepID=A0A372GFK0_9ACTN|nr:PD-(D/E)XK nuclease family protein [Actinomadura spongiicola]RFS83962.1 PD-(D/E)XK nuclease family protein [Actinomadura spongiicola]
MTTTEAGSEACVPSAGGGGEATGSTGPVESVESVESVAAAGSAGSVGVEVVGSLSPSRASDFMTCPLLYRFRVIDRLPERPSAAAARGTLVHAVLERLFDLPRGGRTASAAVELVGPEWERLLAAEPELAALFGDGEAGDAERAEWLEQARRMVERYFELEDPRRLEPAERELFVETVLDSGLKLRGYIDRVDVAPSGDVRIVDYKTGTAPRADFEARALFQMKFYALVLWRLQGRVPRLLQLMYLGNGEVLRYAPDEGDLRATQRKVEALWEAIRRAMDGGEWRPRPGRLCDWCDHKERCPEFGGTPPPLPVGPVGRPSPADLEGGGGGEVPARERDDL